MAEKKKPEEQNNGYAEDRKIQERISRKPGEKPQAQESGEKEQSGQGQGRADEPRGQEPEESREEQQQARSDKEQKESEAEEQKTREQAPEEVGQEQEYEQGAQAQSPEKGEEDWTEPMDRDFPVVGIGASAGGLKALESFFENVENRTGAAFIVVQHLAPDRQSLISKILSKKSTMRVQDAEDGMRLEPNTVYTKSPQYDVLLSGRTLTLKKPEKGQSLPVDRLFRSMAMELGHKAVGVILSGSGTDGTLGLKEIKGAGGMVMVQDPQEAEYDGMPDSARRSGQFDLLLPVKDMGRALVNYFRHPYHRRAPEPEIEPSDRGNLNTVLKTVLSKTGHDFGEYKKSTVKRRVERRMAVTGIDTLEDYARYLRQDPDEVHALFNDLIINVTSFFRDKQAFEKLKQEAIIPLVRETEQDDLLRVWVPGCATGEEAYTIGMLFLEALDEEEKRLKVKVFGTDINPESIERAREGFYPENIAEDIDSERLKRFFLKMNGKYRVDTRLRDLMIFSVHDITRDPPFSRLELISCRNLLIYMESELQQKILPMLHYGLRPGGYLFLGTSEGVGSQSDMFTPVNRRWKIFQIQEGEFQRQFEFRASDHPARSRRERERRAPEPVPGGEPNKDEQQEKTPPQGYESPRQWQHSMRQLMEQTMLARFAPAGLIVDTNNQIQYFHGDTSSFLRPPRGEPRFDILEMVKPELHSTIAAGLKKARREKRQITYQDIKLRRSNGMGLDLAIIPLSSRNVQRNLLLITFREQQREAGEDEQEAAEGAPDSRVADLEQELFTTKQDLQATIEELETSNEELKSSNEELQANNEELQSTNEELDTSREELQSTNEELETVNAELQKKNEELEAVNDDIRNMFANTNIGTVILDTDLRVKRFTPPATKLFNLIEKDIGRELADIATKLEYDNLGDDAHTVLDTLEKKEEEVRTKDGRWFIMRMFPYRSTSNIIQGLVLNFVDATELKKKEQEAQEAKRQAEAVLETTRQPLLILDSDLKVVSANHAFYEAFQVDQKDTEGHQIYNLGQGQWNIPELKKLLEEIVPENTTFRDFEVEHDFPQIGHKKMLVDARRVDMGEDRPYLILVGFEEKG